MDHLRSLELYPPDKQEKATQTVLEQAEVLSEGWSVARRLRRIMSCCEEHVDDV